MKLIELFTESKTGKRETNEDGIYFVPPFAAVIDGTTSKDDKTFGNITGGRFAMECIVKALESVSAELMPYDLIKEINSSLANEIDKRGYEYGPSAVLVIYNDIRKELISYGDVPYCINGKKYISKKESDLIAAEMRSQFIKQLLDSGVTINEIRKNDLGREKIVDFLKEISEKYSNVNSKQGFPVITGRNIVSSFIKVHKVKPGSEIILASDGYPELFDSLTDTEMHLKQMLEKDILCIDELRGTKGVAYGNISFDDRTYLRFVT